MQLRRLLRGFGISISLLALLAIGPMMQPIRAQVGPDQQAIAALIQNSLPAGTTVPEIVVVQNYALALAVSPSGETAREALLVNNGSWSALAGGAGGMNVDQMVADFGVPSDVAQTLYNQFEATP